LRICTSFLVTIIDDETSQTIKLAHFSVKEYLILRKVEKEGLCQYLFSSQLAHHTVAKMTLDYMLDTNRSVKCEPLSQYLAKYWPEHVKEGNGGINRLELQRKIDQLF
ncbi:hypothetical protein BKA61DRAFT_446302, partial [Leptodontidium sp. MPI-SDFR-AT-0119]